MIGSYTDFVTGSEMQAGDVYQTYAEVNYLFEATGYKSQVTVKKGVAEFVEWYRTFYKK